MSTIKSRWKWIRRQVSMILVLAAVALFPSLPRQTAYLVDDLLIKSGLYDSASAHLRNRSPQRSESSSSTMAAIGIDAVYYESSLPIAELQFSADQGNHLAQYRLLKSAGVDLSDLDGYLQVLYEKQPAPVQSQ